MNDYTQTRRINTRHSTGTYQYDTITSPAQKSTGRNRARTTQKKLKGASATAAASAAAAKLAKTRLKRRRELLDQGLPVKRWVRVKRQPLMGSAHAASTGGCRKVGFECWVWVPYSEVLAEEMEQKKVEVGTLLLNQNHKSIITDENDDDDDDDDVSSKRMKVAVETATDENASELGVRSVMASGPPIPFKLPSYNVTNNNEQHNSALLNHNNNNEPSDSSFQAFPSSSDFVMSDYIAGTTSSAITRDDDLVNNHTNNTTNKEAVGDSAPMTSIGNHL